MALYSSYSGEGQIVRYSKGLEEGNRANSTLVYPRFQSQFDSSGQGAEYRIQLEVLNSLRVGPTTIAGLIPT